MANYNKQYTKRIKGKTVQVTRRSTNKGSNNNARIRGRKNA